MLLKVLRRHAVKVTRHLVVGGQLDRYLAVAVLRLLPGIISALPAGFTHLHFPPALFKQAMCVRVLSAQTGTVCMLEEVGLFCVRCFGKCFTVESDSV